MNIADMVQIILASAERPADGISAKMRVVLFRHGNQFCVAEQNLEAAETLYVNMSYFDNCNLSHAVRTYEQVCSLWEVDAYEH